MPKKYRAIIQGIEEPFEVEASSFNRVAAMIQTDPDRFRMKQARPGGVVGVENVENGKSMFFKIGETGPTLYPVSAGTAAALFSIAA